MALEIQSKQERWKGTRMNEIVRDLQKSADVIPDYPREYNIQDEIHAEDLQALARLPFELTITEERGRLILGTGTKKHPYAEGDEEAIQREATSKIAFHTHPPTEGIIASAPSFADLRIDLGRLRSHGLFPAMIAHPNGLLVYRYTADETVTAIRRRVADFCKKRNIPQTFKKWPETEILKRVVAAQREFAEETGSILLDAGWEEKEKIEHVVAMFREAQKTSV